MLKILIVDDEEFIRNGISRKIQRLLLPVEIVGKAEDADEALELIKELQPNVVITDIRMPGMDGLQFIEKAKSIKTDIKFIVMSGYQEFAYAQKAIKLQVEEYLLKPIDNDQLKETIEKIQQRMDTEMVQQKKIIELQHSGQIFLKNKYLTDILYSGGEFDIQYIIKGLGALKMQFNLQYFFMITIVIENFHNIPRFTVEEDMPLVKFVIQNIAEEGFRNLGEVIVFENLQVDNQICIIINHSSEVHKKAAINKSCDTLQNNLKKLFCIDVSIGIGRNYANFNRVKNSYWESNTAVMQKISRGNAKIIHIDDVPKSNQITFFLSDQEKLLLFSYINSSDYDHATKIIENIFKKIKEKELCYSNIKTLVLEIFIMLGKIVTEAGINIDNIFYDNVFSEKYISQYKTLEELQDSIYKHINSICCYFEDLKKSDGKTAVVDIKEYINNYYYVDINLTQLASKYYINPSYLSQLFKSETGEKFVDYVAKVRIEKSKDLLMNTSLKAYEIAEMVGYNNSRYFSEVFIKHVGCTPTQYREII